MASGVLVHASPGAVGGLLVKLVYLAHPLGAPTPEGISANRDRARRWLAWAWKHTAPDIGFVADWILCTEALPETPENRERGLRFDVAVVGRCDEMWLVGGRISAGMELEAKAAADAGLPVRDLTALGDEPPKET